MHNSFSQEKKRLLDLFSNIIAKIEKLEEKSKVELKEIKTKINIAINNLESEKFSIAFFGAFSDGKSTILSALTQRLNIKISPEPTTNNINEYLFDDYLIIDTPGLFSEYLMHDEKTKKYISEANLVIYTVSSTNPLKESHHLTVRWLLNDLGKTDETIFVINKMDEVADITDEKDFDRNCKIKREVVKNTLKQIIGTELNPEIICISADPAGLGLEYWMKTEYLDNYQKLSRLDKLKEIIDRFIEKSKDHLIIKAGISVIKDSIGRVKGQLEREVLEVLKKSNEINSNLIKEQERRLNLLESDIRKQYSNIKEELLVYRESLLNKIETCVNLYDLRRVYMNDIGEDAYVIEQKVNLIIKKYLSNIEESINAVEKQIEQSVEVHKELSDELMKPLLQYGFNFGQKIVSMSTKKIMSKLLEIRRSSDILREIIKFSSGGEAIKWASKWASKIKNFAKVLKSLPIIIDIITGGLDILNEKKFKSNKEELENIISILFKDLFEDFTEKSFQNDYFPLLNDIYEMINHLKKDKEEKESLISMIEDYLSELYLIQKGIN